MREEVISSAGTVDPTPAASSAGASSPAGPANLGSLDSKAASLSCLGSQPPRTSLSTSVGGSALASSRPLCRPWERGDLLRRLATFKPSNWARKPKVASSLACAQRGWINIDVDQIVCESCGACLSLVSLPSSTPDEADDAGEVFAAKLDTGHKVACPWRGNSCPESLAQFPPTPQSALIGGYKDRCDGLLQFQILPIIVTSAIEKMQMSRGPQIDRLLSQIHNLIAGESENIPEFDFSQDGLSSSFSQAQKLISLCGWEPRWLANIQDCEEHSAQSARNGCSFGPSQAQVHLSLDPGPRRNGFSSAKKDTGKKKMLAVESRSEFRSPLLDCSLCGATVRISDFLTVPQPTTPFAQNNIDIPDTSKKLGLIRGASAASGISGWVAADDLEKEQTEDRDEVATTNVDLSLTMAGGLTFSRAGQTSTAENIHNAENMGRDLMIGQPASSEVGDRAASYESRGPSSRKRSLEIGGSSDNRGNLRIQQHTDSFEGTIIDRDGDEVTNDRQDSAGPSKRSRDTDVIDTFCSPCPRDSSGAGPSHSFWQGTDQVPSTRDSTRASSVIAIDTVCHSSDDDSAESVENRPGAFDEIHFPSSSTYGNNMDMNETSEINYSNQAQQSICLQPGGEMVVSSTNVDRVTAHHGRDGVSFGISGGSVGMCASHEAEIHGTYVSVHRTNSVVGDVEPRIGDTDNQGQTGESMALMDEIVPDEVNREDLHGDSQEMISRSIGRDDGASKVDGSTKAESLESGEKASESCKLENRAALPSLSCNANVYSGYETTNKEVAKGGKSSSTNNCPYPEADYAMANGIGPPKGESNYEEATKFDPIVHHNQFCPWVNGNVAAAGCSSSSSASSADTVALCGWQLTLDALDTLRLQGNVPMPTGQSESAASLYKDEHQTPGQKLIQLRSMSRSKSRGPH
ncbi:hypothetical protein ACFE04_014876 [Oxalis oulophora]